MTAINVFLWIFMLLGIAGIIYEENENKGWFFLVWLISSVMLLINLWIGILMP